MSALTDKLRRIIRNPSPWRREYVKDQLFQAAAEIERLETAIMWALGHSPEGLPEFLPREEGQPAYWWRKQLREIAFPKAVDIPTSSPEGEAGGTPISGGNNT